MSRALTPAIQSVGASAAAGVAPGAERPSPMSIGPSRGGPTMGRRPPVVRLCADEDERFAQFQTGRIVSQQNIAGALGRGKTWEDIERVVPREDSTWQSWYLVAESIARCASGQELQDDFYNCLPKGKPTGAPIGRGSTPRIGEAVHQVLQKRYLAAKEYRLSRLVVERRYYDPWRPGRTSRPRGRDLIDIRADERLDSIGALSWSMGSAETPNRIDIGDLTNHTIHEIKPVRSYGLGVLQLWQYVHNFNLSKYFDERSAGATEIGKRMRPGGPVASILDPIPLKDAIRNPTPGEARWVAHPWMLDSVPGIIAYTLGRSERPEDGTPEALHTAIRIAVIATLAVLLLAGLWAVAQAAPEILAFAHQTAVAALEAAKAKLITQGAELVIGMQPILQVAESPLLQGAVRSGAIRIGAL